MSNLSPKHDYFFWLEKIINTENLNDLNEIKKRIERQLELKKFNGSDVQLIGVTGQLLLKSVRKKLEIITESIELLDNKRARAIKINKVLNDKALNNIAKAKNDPAKKITTSPNNRKNVMPPQKNRFEPSKTDEKNVIKRSYVYNSKTGKLKLKKPKAVKFSSKEFREKFEDKIDYNELPGWGWIKLGGGVKKNRFD